MSERKKGSIRKGFLGPLPRRVGGGGHEFPIPVPVRVHRQRVPVRLPLAERIVEHELDVVLGPEAAAFHLASAGTWGHDGAAMEPHARQVLAERGVRHSGFVARELLPEHLVVADLVLTGSAEQRHQVTLLDAHAVARAFTLREFARPAEGLNVSDLRTSPPARARELVARMAARRAQLRRRRWRTTSPTPTAPRCTSSGCAPSRSASAWVPSSAWWPAAGSGDSTPWANHLRTLLMG